MDSFGRLPAAFFLVLMLVAGARLAPSYEFKCYQCYPNERLNQCNEPQDSQLVSCPAGVCWMTMKENTDKTLTVSRGCGKAMEAPQLRADDCKKSKDKYTGATEQICNCNAPRCNKNNCRKKSGCFI